MGKKLSSILNPTVNEYPIRAFALIGHSHDDYPVSYPDIAARDAITGDARYEGVIAYVISDQTTYQLRGGTENTDWVTLVTPIGGTSHTLLTEIGTNTHVAIDSHIADATLHFTQAAISITESQISDLQSYSVSTHVHPIGSITGFTDNSTNWDLAFGWGDHSLAGYISGYTVTEGDVTAHQAALSITESQISDLQSYALSTHNHDGSYIIPTDGAANRIPVFTAAAAAIGTSIFTWDGAIFTADKFVLNNTLDRLTIGDGTVAVPGLEINATVTGDPYINLQQLGVTYSIFKFDDASNRTELSSLADDITLRPGNVDTLTLTQTALTLTGNIILSGTVDGRDVLADGTAQDSHIADATIHFTEASISIPLTQGANDVTATAAELNLLDLAGLTTGFALLADSATTASWQALPTYAFGEYVGVFDATTPGTFPVATNQGDWFNCTVAGTIDSQPFIVGDTLIALVDSPSTTIFAANWTIVPHIGVGDHTLLTNIGTNTHAQIDTHISDATIHFTEGSISIPLTQGANDVTALAAELNLLDLSGLTVGWVLSADSATTASWKAQTGAGGSIGGSITDNQVAVGALTANEIEGSSALTFAAGVLDITGSITLTGTVDGIDIATDVAANTLKVTNATHTGQVTGATALALDVTAITAQPASGAIVATDTIITNDGGVLSEATFTQMITFFDANLTFAASGHTHLLAAGATDVTATAAEVNLLDLAALTAGDVLVAATASTAAWRQLVEADISDFGSYSVTGHTHTLSQVTDVTATVAEVNLLDLAGLTAGWVLSADTATTASWKAPTGGGVTDHTLLTNIGTNTHAQIDTFIGTTVPTTYAPLANPVFTGSFTSPGIDDNADATAITIGTDESVTFTGAAVIQNAQALYADDSGGTPQLLLQRFSDDHTYLDATTSSDIIFRTNGITTALTLDASQNAQFAGTVGAENYLASRDAPYIRLYDETVAAAANNRQWDLTTFNEELILRPLADNGAANDPSMVFTRTLNVTDQITFSANSLLFQGSGGGTTTTNFTGNLDVSGAVYHGSGNQILDSSGSTSTLSGGLTTTGNLSSKGITEVAVGTRLYVNTSNMDIGTNDTTIYSIEKPGGTGGLNITGGQTSSTGGSITLYGQLHATLANDVTMNSGANTFLTWDESAGSFVVGTGVGAKTTALTLDSSQNATFAGNITTTGTVDGIDIATDVGANTTHRGLTNTAHGAVTTATASTIVARDANGYINAVFFNSSSGDNATAATHYIFMSGSDGYHRRKTLANVKTELVTTAAIQAAGALTNSLGSGVVTASTSAPSGGSNGDVWLQY